MSAHRQTRICKRPDKLGHRRSGKVSRVSVGVKADGLQQTPAGQQRMNVRVEFGCDMEWNPGRLELLAGNGKALHVGERQALGLGKDVGELAEDNLCLAFGLHEIGERPALTFPRLVEAELVNGLSPVLNSIDSDFLLSVADGDRAWHGVFGLLSTPCHARLPELRKLLA